MITVQCIGIVRISCRITALILSIKYSFAGSAFFIIEELCQNIHVFPCIICCIAGLDLTGIIGFFHLYI